MKRGSEESQRKRYNVAGIESGEGTMTQGVQRTLEGGKGKETDFPLERKSALSIPSF